MQNKLNRGSLSFMMVTALFLLVILVTTSGRVPGSVLAGDVEIMLEPLATGFSAPTDIAFDPVNGRPHVTERLGTVVTIADGAPGPIFLDITDRVASLETQQGLFSILFHPDYANNRYFYVHYTDVNGDTQISRFTANMDLMTADPNSEFTILNVDQPYDDNNGGDIAFGPDGYLYVPLGDGGDLNDPGSNAQSGDTLLGKILRLDVDGGSPYAIPPDNPYVDDPDVLDEIWAFGLRNPWRISFDRETGDLYIADVGQYESEEVNFQSAASSGGENHGWSCFEGTLSNPDTNVMDCAPAGSYDSPFFEYPHNPYGCAIAGGYVYRGQAHPELYGHYIFNDWCTGFFWEAIRNGPGDWTVTEHDEITNTGMAFGNVGYGEDNRGELYVLGNNTVFCLMSCGYEGYTYLPVMSNGQAAIDLSLAGLEVTQATQTTGMNVPLVAGRPAMLRIYAETSEAAPTPGVDLAVAASRNGVPLTGSPLLLNDKSVPPEARRNNLDSTINVMLPAAWLQGDVDLQVTLDPGDTVLEWDEDNNDWFTDLQFTPVPALNITIVPIRYTHTPLGQTYSPPSVDTISDFLMRTYPVSTINVNFRSAYNFVGNLDVVDEWRRLLNEVTTLRTADSPPPDVFYYALIPVVDNGDPWFEGGTAGIGWIGNQRAAAGLDLTPIWQIDYSGKLAAHEIGHNLNRLHAPCGVATALDPDYPYETGKIGQFGLDVSVPQLFQPSITYDFMSYCHDQWLSDYTYKGLLAEITAAVPTSPAGQQESLLVRAVLDGEGEESAAILPVYALSGRVSPVPAQSEYTIEMLDESGRVVATHPVQKLYAAEEGVEVEMIVAMLPQPAGEDVAALRLVQDGRVLATRDLVAPTEATHVTVDQDSLRWTADQPALVRYSADGGQTWQTLAVDAGNQLVLPPDLDLIHGELTVIPAQ